MVCGVHCTATSASIFGGHVARKLIAGPKISAAQNATPEMVLSVVRRLFHKHRYIGNAIFYTGLLSAADVVSQKIQYGVISEHDFARTGRMATMGFVYFGPALTFIYDNLDKMLPGNARKTIIKKMLIDQTMITSLSMVVFYVGKCSSLVFLFCLPTSQKILNSGRFQ